MNYYKKVILLIIIFGFFSPVSMSQEKEQDFSAEKFFIEETKVIKAGVLPDSFWYWADIFGEQLRFVFTISKETKGQYLLDLAEERMAELRVLTERGITKYTDTLISRHEEEISKAEKFLAMARDITVEEFRKQQLELEKEILKQEKTVKKKALQAPEKYEEGQQNFISKIGSFLARVKSHLSNKKNDIELLEAQITE